MTELEAIAAGDFHRDNWSKAFLLVGLIALVIAGLLVAAVIVRPTSSQYDPLGNYPQQTVDKLTYHLNQTVNVTAQKCAKSDGVMVHGDKSWTAVLSPGIHINEAGGSSALRFKSCGPTAHTREFHYRNLIPQAVAAIVRQSGPSLWRISGTDVPYDSEGRQGVARTWATQTFRLVP